MNGTRIHYAVTALAALAATAGMSLWRPAPAQAAWDWALRCFSKQDIDVLHPLIQKMLHEDPVGARRPWCSASGRRGYIYLLAGGERAGTVTATVKITRLEATG